MGMPAVTPCNCLKQNLVLLVLDSMAGASAPRAYEQWGWSPLQNQQREGWGHSCHTTNNLKRRNNIILGWFQPLGLQHHSAGGFTSQKESDTGNLFESETGKTMY
jgi:hypothetical protein